MKRTLLFFLSVLSATALAQAPRPPLDKLSQMRDTNIASPADGDALIYDAISQKWKNEASSGGTPGGSNTQLQYNNAGAFGGIVGATTDGTNVTLRGPIMDSVNMGSNLLLPAWGQSGARYTIGIGNTQDTTSSGAVGGTTATNTFAGGLISATNATTYARYVGTLITDPTASTNATFTTSWALGADSARIGTTSALTIDDTGALVATSPSFATSITSPTSNFSLLADPTTIHAFAAATAIAFAEGAVSPHIDLGGGTGAAELRFLEPSGAGTNYVGFTAPATLAGNLHFKWPQTDGANGDMLVTDSNGNLSFTTPSGATTPGGSSGDLQYNNSSAFGGVSPATYDGTTLQVKAGTVFQFADPTTPTKKMQLNLAGVTGGATRTMTVPDANFVGVVADTGASNNFLTAISGAGVISKAQPAIANLSDAGQLSSWASIATSTKAASGANTDITSVALNQTGLNIKDGGGTDKLQIKPNETLGADRVLNLKLNSANRTLDFSGDLTLAAAFATSGANNLTLTTTATTNATLPSGTVTLLSTANISDTAFASSWDAVTTNAPSKNAVYDWGHTFDTDDDGKVNVLDIASGTQQALAAVDANGVVSTGVIKRDANSSTSGTPGTNLATITAAASMQLVCINGVTAQASAANTQILITITYSDSTTTTDTSGASSTQAMWVNDAAILRSQGTVTAHSSKKITSVAITTAGSGTGARSAIVSAIQVPQ